MVRRQYDLTGITVLGNYVYDLLQSEENPFISDSYRRVS